MKKTVIAGIVAGCLVALVPRPVQAGSDEALAALGGFVGGVILSEAARTPSQRVIHQRTVIHRDVVVDRPARVRYEMRPRKRWVPGCWVYERGPCGGRVRVWDPGHWETVYVRVKVKDYREVRRYPRRGRCSRW